MEACESSESMPAESTLHAAGWERATGRCRVKCLMSLWFVVSVLTATAVPEKLMTDVRQWARHLASGS